jgi:hypothetical protein
MRPLPVSGRLRCGCGLRETNNKNESGAAVIRRFSNFVSIALLTLLTACGGGGGGGSGPGPNPPNPPPDTTPNGFTFTAQTGVAPSAAIVSNEVTIAGINANAAVSITGGEYSIAGGAFTSTAGTIANNQSVRVRVTSSAQFATAVSAVFTVGGVSATFSATTRDADTTPDAFQFQDVVNVNPNTAVSSNAVTITGIEVPVAVSIANGEYSIDGGAFTSAAGTLGNNQSVQVRLTSSSLPQTTVESVLTIGGVSGTFRTTTRVFDTTPDAFQFAPVANVNPDTAVSSNAATIAGIDIPVALSISNGQYSIEGGPFTSAAGTIGNNQSVRVRVTSSAQFETAVNAVLTVGGVSATFTATTRSADTTPDAFQFAPMTGVPRNAWATSGVVTLTGFEIPVPVSVENGEFSIASGTFRSSPGTISPGQTLSVRLRSASTYSTTSEVRVTVGGVSAEFEVTTEVPPVVSDVAYDGQDVVYLLYGPERIVARWSISAAQYLAPWDLGVHTGIAATLAYSDAHDRLYIGYDSADIRYFDLNLATPTEVQFANVTPNVIGPTAPSLVAAGNYLAAQEDNVPFPSHYVFDVTGAVSDHEQNVYYSQTLAFDAASSRVYHFRDRLTPNDLHFDVVNSSTGQITSTGDSPYHGEFDFQPPIRISSTGQYLLLGTGDYYDRATLEWSGTVGAPVVDGRWMDNGALITLSNDSGETVLRRLTGAQLSNAAEQRRYAGQALRVLGTDARMAVLVIEGGAVRIHTYVPVDDSDGDGVPNAQDAFPADAAASVDTDRDGYPDALVSGVPSTTGLQVDAFPMDAACWLASHGSGGACNSAATVPAFVPEHVIQAGDTIYLLSIANRRVYRWSISGRAYINPYVVGHDSGFGVTAPTRMAFSASHQRLYLGYASGAVRYLDIATGSAVEHPYMEATAGVIGLAAAGNYMLVQDAAGWGQGTRYIVNRDGATTQIQDAYLDSREYAWDANTSRLYFFRDHVSPNNLIYAVINQTTGMITSTGQTPYHGDYVIAPPIRVSPNGQQVLLGSGDFYQQSDLQRVSTLGAAVADARWMANGAMTTLTGSGGLTTLRRLSSGTFSLQQHVTFAGLPLRVVGSDTELIVLTLAAGTVQFHVLVPSEDIDGDGVPNAQDAFPTDPAASADTDRDGYPDVLVSGVPSTTGLQLDAFPQDSACWLVAHGSGGVCDYAATVPAYVPDQVFNDGDVAYLLSRANRRVYRWSIATGQYLNPYVVGISDGLTTTAPVRVAYSAAHQRLYVGYLNGVIRYIAAGSAAEQPFAMLPEGLDNLASVGNYLLAHDANGQWATRYVLNANGAITGQTENNSRPIEYTWDPVSSRVYFTRDTLTPNDLEYEVVDQTTGAMPSRGESPYHGNFPVEGPVRVSADGSRILIGTGYLHSRTGLTLLGSIGKTVKDAHWKEHILVDVDANDLVEVRDADTRAVLTTRQYAGQPLRLVFGQSEAYLVHVVGGTTAFQRLPFNDQDADQIPQWWEQLHGLSDSAPADALGDLDSDGVNNRNEYLGHSNPLAPDTDADGLTDFQEIVTYSTNPAHGDSDGDGLGDQAEVVTHLSNPNDVDSDDDSFSDFIEVLYGGNPNNAGVPPQPLANYTQGFEGTPNLAAWSTPPLSDTSWAVGTGLARTGSASLAAAAGSAQNSRIQFTGYFAYGFLTFHARVNRNSCCDQIEVRVDGNLAYRTAANNVWEEGFAVIEAGVHTIEFRYDRDDFGSPPEGGWIDDVVFDDL